MKKKEVKNQKRRKSGEKKLHFIDPCFEITNDNERKNKTGNQRHAQNI